jgi:hypothetical protein
VEVETGLQVSLRPILNFALRGKRYCPQGVNFVP